MRLFGQSKNKGKLSTSNGCLLPIGIIFVVICIIFASMSNTKDQKTTESTNITMKWLQSELNINADMNSSTFIYLRISGDKKADEINPSDIKLSDTDICRIEYTDSNYSQVIYSIVPLKNGSADITATYDGITSEPITISVNMDSTDKTTTTVKAETESPKTTTSETTTKETTATTTITAKEDEHFVYVMPTGAKYHTKYCRYYNENCAQMTVEEAEQAGYTPCKVCGG